MIRGHSQNVQEFAPFYHWQPPKMYSGGCYWLSGNSILIERWICPQLNVQSIKGSLQNAFLEAVNDKMVQTCVHSENGLGSHFRLYLRPQLINLNEIFRKCVYDTNQNLLFNAIFIHMNQLATNSHFKVYENLVPTLYPSFYTGFQICLFSYFYILYVGV